MPALVGTSKNYFYFFCLELGHLDLVHPAHPIVTPLGRHHSLNSRVNHHDRALRATERYKRAAGAEIKAT